MSQEKVKPVGSVDGFGMIWWNDRPPKDTQLFKGDDIKPLVEAGRNIEKELRKQNAWTASEQQFVKELAKWEGVL